MSLPTGFTVRVHDDVKTMGDARVLVGGSPLRVVRLSSRAESLMNGHELTVDGAAAAVVADRLLEANIALPVLSTDDRVQAADLTVVIPIRDRPHQLDRALASLGGLRTVVVDDASRDARSVAAVARKHGAEVLHLEHNVGPAAARNAGLRLVLTPYVAFVDSDVVVTTESLLGLTAHFGDDRVALVAPHIGGRAVNASPRWFERYEASSPALGLGNRAGVVRPDAAVSWLPSACVVARTDRMGGGFDAGMRIGEDVDLVWRLVAAGHRVRYDPAHEAFHDTRPNLRDWMGRKFQYGTGGAALASRHPDNVITASLSPSMGLAALALLAQCRWSVPVALLSLARAHHALASSLPAIPGRAGLALRLSLRGFGWTLRQESALVLRHWWPATLLAAARSRTARRVIVSAIAVDAIAVRIERPGLHPLETFAGRRLDDLAYGAGLWWGALRSRSPQCLKLRWARQHQESRTRRRGASAVTGSRAGPS